ncbi:hypothetical protein BDN72DRAFT_960188 [Pluteus cervinus]|uniref:Uncharacterized protein n=1 Tax=Pluteus cervinus TaxID=181527 RepID=A0ACD3ARI1_9AGAR|nr:hypothetical protein BDN72DRAFT_960188 [Pluteus cervinus]
MTSIFPAEIVHEFMYFINEDQEGTKTLLSCSLVSQTWCAIAWSYLYVQAALDLVSGTTASPLITTVTMFPHIRAHIHRLFLTVPQLTWRASVSAVSVLGDFPSLRSLQIRPSRFGVRLRGSEGLVENLHLVLSSRFLTSLDLSEIWDLPIEILYRCVALEKLFIKRVTFTIPKPGSEDENDITRNRSEERPFLRSFVLSTQDQDDCQILDFLLSPVSPFDISKLQVFMGLDRRDTDSSYEDHCKFISHVSPTLETILIDPAPSCLSKSLRNPLGPLKPHKLRKISSITLVTMQVPFHSLDAFPWAMALLSGLPTPEILHDITLLCDLAWYDSGEFTLYQGGWLELDALLTRFYNLKRVYVKCYSVSHWGTDNLVSRLNSLLPTSFNKGILFVECSSSDRIYTSSMEHKLMVDTLGGLHPAYINEYRGY